MTAKIRKKNSKHFNVIMKQSSLILILIICSLKIAYGSDHQLKKRSNQGKEQRFKVDINI